MSRVPCTCFPDRKVQTTPETPLISSVCVGSTTAHTSSPYLFPSPPLPHTPLNICNLGRVDLAPTIVPEDSHKCHDFRLPFVCV